METVQHYLDGREVVGTSGRFGPIFDPASGVEQARVALASASEVDAAVASAAAAFPSWRSTSLARRSEILFRFREMAYALKERERDQNDREGHQDRSGVDPEVDPEDRQEDEQHDRRENQKGDRQDEGPSTRQESPEAQHAGSEGVSGPLLGKARGRLPPIVRAYFGPE